MKKLVYLVTTVCAMVLFTACGKQPSNNSSTRMVQPGATGPVYPGGMGYNQQTGNFQSQILTQCDQMNPAQSDPNGMGYTSCVCQQAAQLYPNECAQFQQMGMQQGNPYMQQQQMNPYMQQQGYPTYPMYGSGYGGY